MKKKIQATHEAMFQHMANLISTNKRVTLAIAGTKKQPPFFYTIGNQEKQLPELLIIGNFKANYASLILNKLSDLMIADGTFKADLVSLGGEYPLLIHQANEVAKKDYTIQAGQFYGNEDYDVMQVVLPDTKGCYPPDPKCHKDFQVPVLRLTKKEVPTI